MPVEDHGGCSGHDDGKAGKEATGLGGGQQKRKRGAAACVTNRAARQRAHRDLKRSSEALLEGYDEALLAPGGEEATVVDSRDERTWSEGVDGGLKGGVTDVNGEGDTYPRHHVAAVAERPRDRADTRLCGVSSSGERDEEMTEERGGGGASTSVSGGGGAGTSSETQAGANGKRPRGEKSKKKGGNQRQHEKRNRR